MNPAEYESKQMYRPKGVSGSLSVFTTEIMCIKKQNVDSPQGVENVKSAIHSKLCD